MEIEYPTEKVDINMERVESDRFDLLCRLGIGFHGSVFYVKSKEDFVSYALKIIPDVSSFEAHGHRIQEKMNPEFRHYFPTTFEIGTDLATLDGSPVLAELTEFFHGSSLNDLIKINFFPESRIPISDDPYIYLRDKYVIAAQLLGAGVAYFKTGFTHRDISPKNIYFNATPHSQQQIKIFDNSFSSSNRNLGGNTNPKYTIDPDSVFRDLHSIGLIIYHLLERNNLLLPPGVESDGNEDLAMEGARRFYDGEDFSSTIRERLDAMDKRNRRIVEPLLQRVPDPVRAANGLMNVSPSFGAYFLPREFLASGMRRENFLDTSDLYVSGDFLRIDHYSFIDDLERKSGN